ncbi:Arylsulfotransferase-domain-containing protein [Xylariaceae sp. FL0016]|nr:Arylsulfotransferase-domain-containing protein [Xylariaceae sp. FL0016]
MFRIAAGLLTLLLLSPDVIAHEVFNSGFLYDWGYYGFFPQIQYKTFDLSSPLLNFPQWDERCDDGYYLIAPKGKIVSKPGPMILDSRGDLVWADDKYGIVTDLKVQPYKDELYLTFWSGPHGTFSGYGRGLYYMLDSSYQVFRKFEPVGEGLKGDLHEFHLTKDGTALMTIYNPIPYDLSSIGGPSQGWALDCRFQEIDVETGDLIFEWSALEHVALNDTIRYFAGDDVGTAPENAYDFFHINSLDKDESGNYIVSGRHTQTIHCVDHETGDVLWTLGGNQNDFKDLSDGHATDFAYQHHVRLHANHTMSIFDNAKAERSGPATPYTYSRGMIIQLDTEQMTATLLQDLHDPSDMRWPDSQGSMQVMGDRAVLGYGYHPTIKEFSLDDGKVVCDVRLAPALVSRWGLVTTYRAFKSRDWVATPMDPPDVFLKPSDGKMYVSWNGATQVQKWVLQGAQWDDLRRGELRAISNDSFVDLMEIERDGFETAIAMEHDMPPYLRVAAVDAHGNVLRHSPVINRLVGNAPSHFVRNIIVSVVVLIALVLATIVLVWKKGIRGAKQVPMNVARGLVLMFVPRGKKTTTLTIEEEDAEPGGSHKPARWWSEWRRARAHEMQPLYED